MLDNLDEITLLRCSKCGKKIIGRKANGLFYFLFGRRKERDGSLRDHCPVEILIHGSVRIRCLARECGEWNTFNYFPGVSEQSTSVENQSNGIKK